MSKLVIITGDLNFSVIRGVFEILDTISEVKIIIVEQKQKHSLLEKIKRQKFNLKKNGWRWVLHIILSILKFCRIKTNVNNIRRSGKRYTFSGLTEHPSVDYYKFDSIHSEACLSLIKRKNVDLGISLAAPILKKTLFSLPRLGTINLHKGKLPDYKGMPAGYWEIHNGESEVGISVHKIVAGLDAGDILLEDYTPIYKFSSANGIRVRLDEIGIQLVAKAVSNILEKKEIFVPQVGKGHLYRKPTLKELSHEKKLLLKREGYSFTKEFIKKNIFSLYVLYKKIIGVLLQGQRKNGVSVILFHRVSDEFRDSVTIGVEQFDKLMGHLVRKYTILTLKDILNNPMPISHKPRIIITFDDGYLDNYLNAAPILLKHGISATFFVSTDKITNNTAFDHDLEKLGVGLNNMNWDQVRKMKEWGFDFGSHTVSHPRLSTLDQSSLKKELVGSLQTVKDEIGIKDVMFAYTHGGKSDFTLEARKMAEELGYICICSAYGGINNIPINIYNIKRFGVNYAVKQYSVEAKIEGWGNNNDHPDWA